MTVEQENQYLKEEVKYLKERLEEADKAVKKCTEDTEFSKKLVEELSANIKFLGGQIEAYRDCLNLKR